MTKTDFVKAVAAASGQTQVTVNEVLDVLPDVVAMFLRQEQKVKIPGLAIAELRHVEEREAFNPRTGETFIAPARNRVTIRPVKNLKESVQ